MIIPDGSLKGKEILLLKLIPPFPFTSLPAELRFKIYGLIFKHVEGIGCRKRHSTQQASHRAILSVNKQIRNEALVELYHGRTVSFDNTSSFYGFFARSPMLASYIEAMALVWSDSGSLKSKRDASPGILKRCTRLTSVYLRIPKYKSRSVQERSDTARDVASVFKDWLIVDSGKAEEIDEQYFEGLKVDLGTYYDTKEKYDQDVREFRVLVKESLSLVCG